MLLVVNSEIGRRFPGHATGVWRLTRADRLALETAAQHLQLQYKQNEELVGRMGREVDYWQSIIRSIGGRSKNQSSIKRLAAMMRNKGALRPIQPFVDFYCSMSLNMAIPMAGYDLRFISGQLRLEYGQCKLPFTALGTSEPLASSSTEEVYYRDDSIKICEYWNSHDCDQTKVSDDTGDIVLIADLHGAEDEIYRRVASISEQLDAVSVIIDKELVR